MEERNKDRCRRRLYSKYKASAKNRKIDFYLNHKDFQKLTESNCAYCGSKPSNQLKYSGLKFNYNGIDRIDSSKGYRLGNVLPCCKFCNSLKGSMKIETWADFLVGVLETLDGTESWLKTSDKSRSTKSFFGGR